ncbi:MAG: alpha/beta hydrolase [Bacteroidetes bacterium]|nr:alpha/beta hydrolase [Bacteroidota bacterium]
MNITISESVKLQGTLNIPSGSGSFVIFSHGSGSSRFSIRNRHIAGILNKEKIATLLIDLLTKKEDEVFENRFNINLLMERLVSVTKQVHQFKELKNLPIGYFGASTGAASAIKAAEILNDTIEAVVSRGGRPDLAKSSLPNVKAPTLLIIGSLDVNVIELNKRAYSLLNCEKKIAIIEGATHLFEELGKMDEVAALATDWFKKHLYKVEAKKLAATK